MYKTIEMNLTKDLLKEVIFDLTVSNNGIASYIEDYKALVKKYKNDVDRIDEFRTTLKWAKKRHKEKALLIDQLKKHMEEF